MVTDTSRATEKSTSDIRTVLPGLLLAMLLAMLDATIVSTALPAVVGDLGGFDQLSWVVAAYLLTSTVSTPVWGKLGDQYGRKGLFITAIVIFLAGSTLSGMAGSMGQLIAYRALQGIGAGGVIIGVMTVIGILSPPAERGRYQSYIAALSAVATVGGPLVGGLFTDHLSWRWAFYVNLPIGLVALALIATTLRLPGARISHRIDFLGAGLLTVLTAAVTLISVWGGTRYDWTSPQVLACILVAVVALALTVVVEKRAAEPMLPLALFKVRDFSLSLVLGFMVGIALYGSLTFLPLYEQSVAGTSATSSGLMLLPLLGGQLIVGILSGRAMKGAKQYRVVAVLGGVALTAGSLLLSLLDKDTSFLIAGLYMVVFGIGLGFLFQNVLVIAQNSVTMKDIGAASGGLTFFRTVGGTFGVSLFAAVFTNRLHDSLASKLPHDQLENITQNGGRLSSDVLDGLSDAARSAYVGGVADATQGVFLTAAFFGVLALIAGLTLRSARAVEESPATGGAPAPAGPGKSETGTA
jgi:EmrB/QacA subfamily drug resistance transporter